METKFVAVLTASLLWETHRTEVGEVSPPASIYGLPGGKKPLGSPKLSFEKNFSMGWSAAKGPPTKARPGIPIRVH